MKKPLRYCIIEDDYYTRLQLALSCSKYRPEYTLIGEADDSLSLTEVLSLNPDFAVVDVRLRDCISLNLIQELGISLPMLVISRYAGYEALAQKLQAVSFLVKPVSDAKLCEALEKLDYMRLSVNEAQ